MEEDYETKKKMLFECLETAERGLQGSSLAQTTYNSDLENYRQQRHRSRDEYIDKYKHKDSMFKRPDLPISKCLKSRRRPDFEQNPKKWTKYTLEDVSDTSDRMNTTAAFNFLKDLEDKRHEGQEEDEGEGSGSSGKIVFKKSVRLRPKDDEVDPQINMKKIQSTKIVMPEYVIGEKIQKIKKDRRPKDHQSTSKSSNLKLSHLDEEDDET